MIRRGLIPFVLLLAATPLAAQDYGYGGAPGYAQLVYDTDGQSVDSIDVFFTPLARYGRWIDSRYGRVWAPNVGRDWRPYTIGHWEDGFYGQTWRSDEPFGWAVFHFGRWAFDRQIGWVWSPDTVWGPGWVAWRDGDDVTGWAPLPPQISVGFAFGSGYAFNDWGYDQWYQPGWVYVPRYSLYSRSLRGVVLPFARNREIWERTRGVTRYDQVDGQFVNHSFDGGRGHDDARRNRPTDRSAYGQRDDRAGRDPRGQVDQRGDAGVRGDPRRDTLDQRRQFVPPVPQGRGYAAPATVPGVVPSSPPVDGRRNDAARNYGRGGFRANAVPVAPAVTAPPVIVPRAGLATMPAPRAAPPPVMRAPPPRVEQRAEPRFEPLRDRNPNDHPK